VSRLVSIGFTGTRHGMTRAQMLAMHQLLSHEVLAAEWEDGVSFHAHHGRCVGADTEFSAIAMITGYRVIAHPGPPSRWSSGCQVDELRPEKPFLARDRDIVAESGWLLAAPYTHAPVPHSGTWTTIWYALQAQTAVTVIRPDGSAAPLEQVALQLTRVMAS